LKGSQRECYVRVKKGRERTKKESEEKRTDIPRTSVEFKGTTHTQYLRSGGAVRLQVAPATRCVFASAQNRYG
jgi:hypothetical protein